MNSASFNVNLEDSIKTKSQPGFFMKKRWKSAKRWKILKNYLIILQNQWAWLLILE